MIPRPVQRMGDMNTSGGMIMEGEKSVMVEGFPIATAFMTVSPHYNHYGMLTTATQYTVICNRQAVVKMGDPDTCGDIRVGGASTVLLGGS